MPHLTEQREESRETRRPWSDHIFRTTKGPDDGSHPLVIGVLPGEGSGPEVIAATLHVLSALTAASGRRFEIRTGGPVGLDAEALHQRPLSDEVVDFCRDVFSTGGAVLAGPGGGRFVYDLRRRFDLFCKITPLASFDELGRAGRLKRRHTRGVDILVVRENAGGIYQGDWRMTEDADGRRAEHSFSYSERDVRRILDVGVRLASERRGAIDVVVKPGGIPAVSALWRECAIEIAEAAGVRCSFLDVDYAAYRIVQHPGDLDLVVASNLFGDVVGDVGAVVMGGRGLSFSGNYSAEGASVFQTNHGAAYDLAGTDTANPVGQIFSLAMMLREAFDLVEESRAIERAVRGVWRDGWRTADLAERGCRIAGTRKMAELVADAVAQTWDARR